MTALTSMKSLLNWVALIAGIMIYSAGKCQAACDSEVPLARFSISSGSMLPNLVPGTTAFAVCFYHAMNPKESGTPTTVEALYPRLTRGDVVALRYPRDPHIVWISRVVGLPGDRVQIRQGQLYLNEHLCPRDSKGGDYVADDKGVPVVLHRYTETLPDTISQTLTHEILKETDDGEVNNTPVYDVPLGHVFVLGDNRDNAADSRFMNGLGFIPIANLLGFVYSPPAR